MLIIIMCWQCLWLVIATNNQYTGFKYLINTGNHYSMATKKFNNLECILNR